MDLGVTTNFKAYYLPQTCMEMEIVLEQVGQNYQGSFVFQFAVQKYKD